MKRQQWLKSVCALGLSALALSKPCYGWDEPVRVGFIPDGNFYVLDDVGNLSGYNYDYLLKLAQHTNWDYEFVVIQEETLDEAYLTAREMLMEGELDLLGSQSYTAESKEMYEFGEAYYGVVRTALCTLANNTRITTNNFFRMESLKVALVTGSDNANELFFQMMENYGIEPIVTYVEHRDEAFLLLKEEKVDVIMNTDFSVLHDSLLILETANPVPLYFVSNKGNTELIEEMDVGIAQLEIANAYIIEQLQNQYFSTGHQGPMILTNSEKEALGKYDYFTVGLVKGKVPYQFVEEVDENGVPLGISVQVLDLLAQIIGVEFRYVWADSSEELLDLMEQGKVDIFATLPTDYALARSFNLTLTDPYISNGAVMLRQTGSSFQFDEAYYHFVSQAIPYFTKENLIMLQTIEEILPQIALNGEELLFCDPYVAQYYLQTLNISNVDVQSVSNLSSDVSMGVAKHIDPVIIGLLNHGILHLDPFMVDEIVFSNMIVSSGISLEQFLEENVTMILLSILVVFVSIVSVLVYHARKLQEIARQDGLTKLYNAGYFHKYAGDKTKKMGHGCLVLVDIDYFKQVNDTHGHQMGDSIIKAVAETLEKNFRAGDMVARLGGDEFVVLLEYDVSFNDLKTRCEKILQDLSHKDCEIPVTLSMGAYIFHQPTPYEDLYTLADKALYKVKEQGRNGYHLEDQLGNNS